MYPTQTVTKLSHLQDGHNHYDEHDYIPQHMDHRGLGVRPGVLGHELHVYRGWEYERDDGPTDPTSEIQGECKCDSTRKTCHSQQQYHHHCEHQQSHRQRRVHWEAQRLRHFIDR